MEENDKIALKKTMERITSSMNQRFEKDADLYMPVEDQEKIKIYINENNLEPIKDWFKSRKYSPEILTKVIIQNLWLMTDNNITKFNKIFKACDINIFYKLLHEYILMDKIDIPKKMRNQLLALYFKNGKPEICEQILNASYGFLHDHDLFGACLSKVMSQYSGIEKYNCLYKYASGNKKYIIENERFGKYLTFEVEDMTPDVYSIIYKEHFTTDKGNYMLWRNKIIHLNGVSQLFPHLKNTLMNHTFRFRDEWYRISPMIMTAEQAQEFYDQLADSIYARRMQVNYNLKKKIYERLNQSNHEAAEEFRIRFNLEESLVDNAQEDYTIDELCFKIEEAINDSTYGWLARYFTRKFHSNAIELLDYICNTVDKEKQVAGFLVGLSIQGYDRKNTYLAYTVNHYNNNPDYYTEGDTKRLLDHIARNNILRKKGQNIDLFKEFVREIDYNLFTKLVE